MLAVHVIHLLWDDKGLLWVKAELLLDLLAVVLLQWVAVDTAGTLELGPEADGRGQLDHRRLVGDLLGLGDRLLDALVVGVTLLDVQAVPTVGLESLGDVLSESASGIAV